MADRQPTPPYLVEVVSAESVDDVVAEMATDLAMLEEQLAQLNATAVALERRVKEVGWAARDDAAAGPLLRQVFEHQTAAARAAMAAALDQAVREAEAHVATARAEAESLVADEPRSDEQPFVALPPEANPIVGPRHNKPGTDPVQPPQQDSAIVPADEPTAVMPVLIVDDPRSVELTEDASTAFGEFWVEDQAEASPRGAPSGILDAILPLVALLIIVAVALSWIG